MLCIAFANIGSAVNAPNMTVCHETTDFNVRSMAVLNDPVSSLTLLNASVNIGTLFDMAMKNCDHELARDGSSLIICCVLKFKPLKALV